MISNKLTAVSIRDLLLVEAVWKHSSFRTAARELGISPSGLSHQIRKVEEALGTMIFERSNQQVKATPEGEVLIAHVRDVLAQVGRLDLLSAQTRKPFGGHLRLAAISTLGAYIVPHVINLFEVNFPDVRLDLLEGKTDGLTQRLRRGEIDVLLSCRFTNSADLETRSLFTERFDVIVNTNHALASQKSIHVKDINSTEIITMSDGEGYSEDTLPPTLRCAARQDCNGHCSEIRGLSLETIGTIVSTRGGVSVVPSLASSRLSTLPNVKILRISDHAPRRTINASWRCSSPHQKAFHQLCSVLSELQAVCDVTPSELAGSANMAKSPHFSSLAG